MKKKLIRITTVPISLDKLIEGQLAFMNTYYEVIGVSSGGKVLEAVAKKEGVRVVPIEMTRTIAPFKDLKAVWQLYRLFKKEQPFIVHTHTPKAGIVGMLAAKLASVPIRLHTVAGMPLLEAKGIKRKVLNIVEKITYSCANKVYPNSFGLETIILENKFTTQKKLKVIANGSSNGINTNYFKPSQFSKADNLKLRGTLNIQENDFVFIFVGRLVGDKGINELVAAFQKVESQKLKVESLNIKDLKLSDNEQQSLTDIQNIKHKTDNSKLKTVTLSSVEGQNSKLKTQNSKLLLVGPLETELDPLKKETLQEITTNKNIISVGWQADVRPYLAISNCLVFPSYREGFPNVVIQAGAMGLPSIVTNINGCNEIIKEGENGWMIPVKDEAAILNAMENCLTNSEQFNKAKTNARQLIVDRYEQKVVWEAILEEYKSLEKTLF